MDKLYLWILCGAAALSSALGNSSNARIPSKGEANLVAFQDSDSDSGATDDSSDYDIFYDRLSPDGSWFYEDDYGYVWQPNVAVSDSSWRPYADGHWVWTDRGWCWVSNENFGWATYHYGRWIRVAGVGWVWVPGDKWAPAWVSWRHTDDDDYVGWAPLPPESVGVNFGVHSWCDSYYDIGPAAFAFIQIRDFCRPSYREFFAPAQENFTIINRTRNVTNITYNNNVFYNYGPQYERVSQIVQRQGQQVPNYKINYTTQVDPKANFMAQPQGNQLNVIAPPQKLNVVATKPPPVKKQLGKAQVDHGWQKVPANQAQQIRQKFVQEAPVPKTLPSKPPLPAKPQIQAAQTKERSQPGKPGTVPSEPPSAPKAITERGTNKTVTEQKVPGGQKTEEERRKGLDQKPPAEGNPAQAHAKHQQPGATAGAEASHHAAEMPKSQPKRESHPAPQHVAQKSQAQSSHPQPAPHPQPQQHAATHLHPAPHPQPQQHAAAHPQPQKGENKKKQQPQG
jgi:hypothetical protein